LLGQSFTRSTFERTEQRTYGGAPVGAHPVKQVGLISNGIRMSTTAGSRIPVCEACKQQIKGAYVLATGLAWCPEHFVCAFEGCGRRLLECGFVEENGLKYCEGCFEAHIAPRCAKCQKPIISDCLNAMQKKWHPTCFVCAHCHKPFGNTAFYLENGLAYCEQDWNELFTTKCVACKYPIEAGDRWVEALGNAFHSSCFNCTRCHSNLEGESFFAKNGQPYCKMHA
ncbi:LIM domain protein, partial [Oesophagostomum dentatum]